MEKAIESAKKRLKEKYNFEFPVPINITEGSGARVNPKGVFIGKDNPPEIIEIIILHEAYHIIFGIDQVKSGSFKEKDRGNILPYFQEEMWILNKIREDFPELSWQVCLCEMLEAQYVVDFENNNQTKIEPIQE
jgi:hypothetical protein